MRISLALAILFLASFTGAASFEATAAESSITVEYYDLELNHFFVTAAADEIEALSSGRFFGWVATGLTFPVLAPDDLRPGSTPVCRFYGSPSAGLDSHFYSADPAECERVSLKWPLIWLLESSDVFRAYLPDPTSGACPGGTTPIFRLFNNRSDVNHRYTNRADVAQSMIDIGYVAEGYGTSSMPVAFCAPASKTNTLAMSCTVSASTVTPLVGSNVMLTAACDGNPTQYAWTGCASSSATCVVSSAVPGTQTYLVKASYGSAISAPAGISLAWQARASPPGSVSCSLASTKVSPAVGSSTVLTAICTGSPTSYTWVGCTSSTNTCVATSASSGIRSYSVSASNGSSTSSPTSVNINWQPPGAVSCVLAASNASPVAGTSITLSANCTGNPTSYAWAGCPGSTNTCVATSSTPGNQIYAVTASNSTSTGAAATVAVNWQASSPPPAIVSCSLTASNTVPLAGSSISLTAACTGSPTSYVWAGCLSSTATCVASSALGGISTYSVTANNGISSSAPAVVGVNWQTPSSPPPPGFPTSADFLRKAGDPRASQPYGSDAGYSAMKRMANGQMIVFGMSHTANENNAVETYDPIADAWTVRIPHRVADWGPVGMKNRTFLGNRDNEVNMMLRPLNEYWVMEGEGGGTNSDGNYRGIVDTVNWRWKFIDDNHVWEPSGDDPPKIWDGVGEWIDGLNVGVIYGGTRGNPGDDLHIFIPQAGTPRFTHTAYSNAWGNPSFNGSEMLRYVSQSNWVRGNYLYIYGGIHQDRASVQTRSQTIYKLDVTNPDAPVMSIQSVNTLPPDQAVAGDAVLGDYDALHDLAVVTDGAHVNVYSYTTGMWANIPVNTAPDAHRLSPDSDGTGSQARWSPEVGQLIILTGASGRTFGLRLNYGTVPPPPSANPAITSFTATPANIAAGRSSVLNGLVANAVSLEVDGVAVTLPLTVTPSSTHSYVLVAAGAAGTTPATAAATVTVTAGPPPPPPPPPSPPPPPPFPPAGNLTLTAIPVPFVGVGAVLANSKHLDFARLGNRWYKMSGDHSATGSPLDVPIPPLGFEGGRQEILSFNVPANDWREDTPYYLPASYGIQGADPDDSAFVVTVGNEIWVANSATNRGVADVPGAAHQVDMTNSICAYTPPTPEWPLGHWRVVMPTPNELHGNRAWRGVFDPVRNRVIIPQGNGTAGWVVIDVATATYQYIDGGGDHWFVTAGLAADPVGRKIYLYDIIYSQLWSADMDSLYLTQVANIPEPAAQTQSAVKIAWNPDIRAVVMNLQAKIHAFEVDSGKLTSWPRRDGYIDLVGIYVPTSTVFFDPDTRDIISIGMEDFAAGGGNPPYYGYWRLNIH